MMRKMNKIKGGNKMEYRDYKYAILGEFKSFDEFAQKMQKRTEELIHDKYDKMHENIKRITSELSIKEIDELIENARKDEDIPEVLVEILAGIGLTKIAEAHKGGDSSRAVLALLLLQLFRGDKDE